MVMRQDKLWMNQRAVQSFRDTRKIYARCELLVQESRQLLDRIEQVIDRNQKATVMCKDNPPQV